MDTTLEAIYAKLAAGDPNRDLDSFPLTSLPNDRNDLLWETIRSDYQLSLAELSTLKNSIFDNQPVAVVPAAAAAAASSGAYEVEPVAEEKIKKKRSRPRKDDVNEDGERKKPRSKLEMLQQNYERIKEALLKFKELKGHMLIPYEFRVPSGDPNWRQELADLWLGNPISKLNLSHNYPRSLTHELLCIRIYEGKCLVLPMS